MAELRAGRRTRAVLLLLGFGATWTAGAAAVRRVVPWPEADERAARWEFVRGSDGYEILIFGSSNLRHGLDPDALDRALAERGHRLHSFNLAAEGMHPLEADAVMRSLLRRRPPRLRYLLVELLPHDPTRLIGDNRFAEPVLFWHTPRGTRNALRALSGAAIPTRERWSLGWLHLRHAARRWAAVGEAPRVLQPARADAGDRTTIAANRGFTALDRLEDERYETARRVFLRELPRWQRRVARIDEIHDRALRGAATPERLDRARVREQIAWARALGVEPIFLVPPVPAPTPDVVAAAASGEIPNVLAFNSPRAHADLYRTENRFDFVHLNAAGSERWSTEVGVSLAGWIEARDAARR